MKINLERVKAHFKGNPVVIIRGKKVKIDTDTIVLTHPVKGGVVAQRFGGDGEDVCYYGLAREIGGTIQYAPIYPSCNDEAIGLYYSAEEATCAVEKSEDTEPSLN